MRKPMVFRTFRSMDVTCKVIDVDAEEGKQIVIHLDKVINDPKQLARKCARIINDGFTLFVKVDHTDIITKCYKMTEETFLANAEEVKMAGDMPAVEEM